MDVVRGHFRPEFLNRVDEIILFHRLRREEMGAIVDIQFKRLAKLLEERKISARARRQGPALARRQGLRPGLWRAAAEAGDPEMGAGPAGADAARRRNARRRDGQDRRRAGRLTIDGKPVGGEAQDTPAAKSPTVVHFPKGA